MEVSGIGVDDLFASIGRRSGRFGFAPESDRRDVQIHVATRKRPALLNTKLPSEVLDRKLLKLYREARTYEEEQGVNILFLALGFLKWFEDDRTEEPSWAPLVLLPISLERLQGPDPFVMSGRDEDIEFNVSLREKLLNDFKIELPEVPDSDDWLPSSYFDSVSHAVASQRRFTVDCDAAGLGFFTFSKFLMWRDLDSATWPEPSALLDHPLIDSLMGLENGSSGEPPIADDDERIDGKIDFAKAIHILNADSSQAVVVEEARRGYNLAVQGPPGTGKSQTIANIIASAVHENKSVLFVAEKAAALNVVSARLKACGLEPLCLELHSRKATKATVIASLARALSFSGVASSDERNAANLRAARDTLNDWTDRLLSPIGDTGRTPYQVIGAMLTRHAMAGLHGANADTMLQPLLGARAWNREQLSAAEGQIDRAAAAISKLGHSPESDAWFGTSGEMLSPVGVDRLATVLGSTAAAAQALHAFVETLRQSLHHQGETDLARASDLARTLGGVVGAPAGAEVVARHDAWRSQQNRIRSIVTAGTLWRDSGAKVASKVSLDFLEHDLPAMRRTFALHGRSPFRIFQRSYRDVVAELRSFCRTAPPKRFEERMALLDSLVQLQAARALLVGEINFCTEIFESMWNGENTSWKTISKLVDWTSSLIDVNVDWVVVAAAFQSPIACKIEVVQGLETASSDLRQRLESLQEVSAPDLGKIFGASNWQAIPLARLHDWLSNCHTQIHARNDWIDARKALTALDALGMSSIAVALTTGDILPEQARPIADVLIAEALWQRACNEDPLLAEIDGSRRAEIVRDFRACDRKRIENARVEVMNRYAAARPRGDAGEMGVIRAEIGKKRRHLPIRKLMKQAGTAIQRLKPVFLMSPLSAANFLPPGRLQFDLIVIDEASQVPPEEALGVIARAKQMVVVGDDMQLPPTNFFKMALDDGEEVEDEESTGRTRDFESILKLAGVRGVSQRMLKWHYRSRHPSLIALSNKECYGGALLLPPSPRSNGDGLGLSFVRTPSGHYERGGTGRNLVEADIVARQVEQHITRCAGLSLGVACFSLAQREAIEDALQRRGLAMGTIKFNPHDEDLFVKNLETVQGDERDVIFISVGYGKDAEGRMIANFGPVSKDGGERRLNVLISRARNKCIVFSSIGAADISVDIKTRGTRMLREFLHYAETGHISAGNVSGADFDSPFEEAVALTLRKAGYQIEPQVGVSSFRVDLGVIHPEHPGQFVLGIECDGAAYHSARSARDRDRLRQEVLEGLGWKLHRIWSTDWFRNPAREAEKALAAIKAALEGSPGDEPLPVAVQPVETTEAEGDLFNGGTRVSEAEHIFIPAPCAPYKEADLPYIPGVDILALSRRQLLDLCVSVVKVEGPIHSEEIARRVREAFNLDRTGRRILDSVIGALRVGRETRVLVAEGDFLDLPDRKLERPRDRRMAAPSIRRADRIAPKEYKKAIELALIDAVALCREELMIETARSLGFDRTGIDLQVAIGMQIDDLVGKGEIVESETGLRKAPVSVHS